jgi:hypothetical protein
MSRKNPKRNSITLNKQESLAQELSICITELTLFINNPEEILDEAEYVQTIIDRLNKVYNFIIRI